MDSPSRQPVPQFGAWKMNDPYGPVIDYTEVFARARASRLGSIPADHYEESCYGDEDAPNFTVENRRTVVRQSSRRNFLQYFMCGARAQAVA